MRLRKNNIDLIQNLSNMKNLSYTAIPELQNMHDRLLGGRNAFAVTDEIFAEIIRKQIEV